MAGVALCVFHFKLRLVHFNHLTRDFQIFKAQGLDVNYTVLKRMCDEYTRTYIPLPIGSNKIYHLNISFWLCFVRSILMFLNDFNVTR